MRITTLLLFLAGLTVVGYYMGRYRALSTNGGIARGLVSLPSYHGYFMGLLVFLPTIALIFVWNLIEPNVLMQRVLAEAPAGYVEGTPFGQQQLLNNIRTLAAGGQVMGRPDATLLALGERYRELSELSRWLLVAMTLGVSVLCGLFAMRHIGPRFRARSFVESAVLVFLMLASSIAILTTLGIVLSVFFETLRFLDKVPITEFLFGLEWSPQTAIRDDQVGASGVFGSVPLIVGTLLITTIAMLVAVPVGLLTAIYLSEYASRGFRSVAKPLLEVLAGIPTVVYGFFAALTVAPLIRRMGESVGLTVASESALAAGLVMGIMIIPLVSSLSDDAISAVPQSMRDGSLGLGATRSETVRQVIVPAALPGIVGGILLAVSRAIGETMIVVMAAGLSANLTINPLEAVTTVTVQMVTLLQGDQEFDSAKTLAAFALGLSLFLITLGLNVIGLRIVRKYREQYE